MAYETLVVAYERADRANGAVEELRRVGVPRRDIRRHPIEEGGVDAVAEVPEKLSGTAGILAWLLGEDAVESRIDCYRRALSRGGTIISVRVLDDETARIREILERYGPVDLAETDATVDEAPGRT